MLLKLNRAAYVRLVEEDLAWLLAQPRTLEREHIEAVVRHSIDLYYPNGDPWPTGGDAPDKRAVPVVRCSDVPSDTCDCGCNDSAPPADPDTLAALKASLDARGPRS